MTGRPFHAGSRKGPSNVPDHRQHRGPHPGDVSQLAPDTWPRLLAAVEHLAWLLTRGYAMSSSLKLVGDRFQLSARQRLAVRRSTCSDQAFQARTTRCVAPVAVQGRTLILDGFNLLTTVEAALARGILLRGRDGCIRDMASMHGSYRKVVETEPALRLVQRVLSQLTPGNCHWILDRPVSNSGRLRQLIERRALECQLPWTCDLADDADPVLQGSPYIVVTADSAVLDTCGPWFNLAACILQQADLPTLLVPLDGHGVSACSAPWPQGNVTTPLKEDRAP